MAALLSVEGLSVEYVVGELRAEAVSDVSLEVGFESVSHFIHRFRRRFAVTPKQFQMSQSRQNQSHAR